MHSTITPFPHACWQCGVQHETLASIRSKRGTPSPGALLLCVACGEWAVITDTGTPRRPTDAEFLAIGASADCRALRLAWAAYTAVRGGHGRPHEYAALGWPVPRQSRRR